MGETATLPMLKDGVNLVRVDLRTRAIRYGFYIDMIERHIGMFKAGPGASLAQVQRDIETESVRARREFAPQRRWAGAILV